MSDLTHYLAVKATESDGTPVNVLLSNILYAAHRATASRFDGDVRRQFGVAFPGASEAESKPKSAPEGGYRSAADEVETYRISHLRSKPTLGDSIQFFGKDDILWQINEVLNRLPRGMKEFIELAMPKPIPEISGFVYYKRARNAVRTEATIQRELRRTMRRHPGDQNVASEAALEERRGTIVETSRLPYISMRSSSSAQDFNVHFEIVKTDKHEAGNGFNGYGFSSIKEPSKVRATVPLITV